MTGSVIINGKLVELSATLGAMLRYKEQFGEEYNDDITELSKLKEQDDEEKYLSELALIGFKLLWAMAKTADGSIPPPDIWAEEFKDTDIAPIMLEAISLYAASLGEQEEQQETQKTNDKFTTEGLVALCALYGIGISELDRLSVDMLLKIMNEMAELRKPPEDNNDGGIRKATPKDIEMFFG